MSLSLRVLRLYLHSPDLQKIPIGYISSFGDLVRISFDENYISHPNRLVFFLKLIRPSKKEIAKRFYALRRIFDLRVVMQSFQSFFRIYYLKVLTCNV